MGLEIVELIIRLEEKFAIEIPDADAERLATIEEIEHYIAGRLDIPAEERDALFERIRAIVVDELGVPPGKVRRETRLVEDLDLG
jgi:acyl carrier protein